MLHPDHALERLLSIPIPIQTEKCTLTNLCNDVLAEDIFSPLDIPPWNKAAMDGYAYSNKEWCSSYTIIGTISAGSNAFYTLNPGQCVKIMTGARVPNSATHVVRMEYTRSTEGAMEIVKEEMDTHIVQQGEYVKKGDRVLSKHQWIHPAIVGVLASCGMNEVTIVSKPRIEIVATGSELISPGNLLTDTGVYDCNSFLLHSQLKQLGMSVVATHQIADDYPLLQKVIKAATEQSDILLISGGVSVGDYDYVPHILRECGYEFLVEKVAMKPGKPLLAARKGNSFIFGLPGNPISCFLGFELFVKPFIHHWMHVDYAGISHRYVLGETIQRKGNTNQVVYLPITLRDGMIYPVAYHGSGDVNTLSMVKGFIRLDLKDTELKKGEPVYVRLL